MIGARRLVTSQPTDRNNWASQLPWYFSDLSKGRGRSLKFKWPLEISFISSSILDKF
jgi:hypothetical protein